MRVKEKFRKLGYFWLPSIPDKKVPGTLAISDEGVITLEVIRGFDDNRMKPLFSGISRGAKPTAQLGYTERIVGYIENDREYIKNDGRVTLDDCYLTGYFPMFQQPAYDLDKLSIFVERAFIHVEYDEGEIPRFKNFTFSLEGIEEWSGINNFRMLEYDESNITLSYQAPSGISPRLNDDMHLLIKFPGTYTLENRIAQKTYFELISPNAHELNEFISVAEKIRALLCFAINERVPFDNTSAVSNSRKSYTGKPLLIDIYDSRCFYLQNEPKINKGMLFQFEKMQSDAGLIINKWIEVYEDIRSALDLYFTAQEQQYLPQKFLNMAQSLEAYHKGVEAYHKRISGKKPSKMYLKDRLRDLSEPLKDRFENENMRDKWTTDVKKARNQLTHQGKLESIETYNELNDFIAGCLQIFQINLLQLIGFSQEDIDSIFAGSTPIRR